MGMEHLSECNLCKAKYFEALDPINNICRCTTCGYIFDNPRPDKEELIIFYSKPTKYDAWLKEEEARDSLWKRRLKKMRNTRQGGTLLDIGTGIGQFLFYARAYYDEVLGTEVSESAIDIAREKYGMNVLAGEIETIEVNKRFDVITMFHVLEHVYDPRAVIEKCRALLADNGYLVIAVPNDVLSWETQLRIILKRIGVKRFRNVSRAGLPKLTLDGSLSEIHVSHFTSDVLRKVLEKKGFKVIEDSLDPYFAASGFRLILHYISYYLHGFLFLITGRNRYDNIWMVAQKTHEIHSELCP